MTESTRNMLAACGLMLAVWAVYWPAGGFGFIALDDPAYTYHNPHVRGGLDGDGVRGAFFAFHNGGWHPLTTLSQQLDVTLFGLAPGPMHLVNVLLHGFTVVLLFFLFQQAAGAWLPALVAAGWFAVHPLHVEPVAWIASRKDMLSGCFIALALLAYTHYGRQPGAGRHLVVTLACCAAFLSKGTAVVLPALFLLWDRWPLGRWEGRHDAGPLVVEKLPWFGLALPVIWINGVAQDSAGALRGLEETGVGLRLANAAVSVPAYLGQTFWPAGLSPYYPLPLEGYGTAAVVAGAALVLVLTVAALAAWQRTPAASFGWLWFLVALSPVLGIAAIGDHARADRFTYVPHMGLFLAFAWCLYRVCGARVAGVAGAVSVAVLALAASGQVRHWESTGSLFAHAVSVDPANPLAHLLLGQALDDDGEHGAALHHLELAVALRPTLRDGWNSLGLARAHLGDHAGAVAAYDRELALAPDQVMARTNRANSLLALGQADDALAAYGAVVADHPGYADGHGNYGSALLLLDRAAEAVPWLERARELAPEEAHWHINLAAAYWAAGREAEARAALGDALALAPDHPAARALAEETGLAPQEAGP